MAPEQPIKGPRPLGSRRKIRVWEFVAGEKTGRVRAVSRRGALQEIKRALAVEQLPDDVLFWPAREAPLG